MRLLNTTSLRLRLFIPGQVPDYVILSHRWSTEEVTFEDFNTGDLSDPGHPARIKNGFQKVAGACKLAVRDNYEWIWIDSCCIDKSSSAILQESINSMWSYYANANMCYVYLADVPDERAGMTDLFAKSCWFERGWTLQELIAPRHLEFYAEDWSMMGTKRQRCDEISRRTHVNVEVLLNPALLDLESVANRMSWAAHRYVTREEDQAYSLLGLFQVNMPMLYGEGQAKAFGRLQEAIYNTTRDDSLFLFRFCATKDYIPLLASSPTQFCPLERCQSCLAGGIECLAPDLRYDEILASSTWATQAHEQLLTTVTHVRLEASTTLLLLERDKLPNGLVKAFDVPNSQWATHVAILNHTSKEKPDGALCLLLRRPFKTGAGMIRLSAFPILVPSWRTMQSQAQPMKVLFASEINAYENITNFTTLFEVKGDLYYAYAWKVKDSTTFDVLMDNSDNLTNCCLIRSSSSKVQPTKVLCSLHLMTDFNDRILLSLQRDDGIWLIKEVVAPTGNSRGRKQQILHRSSRLTERCKIRSSSNKHISISVRPLPAGRADQTMTKSPHIRNRIEFILLPDSQQ